MLGDLYESIKDTLFDFENSGVHYASSKEIFEEMLESFSKINCLIWIE